MAFTGLRRTRNPCSSSLSIIVHVTYMNFFIQRYESVLENLQQGDDWHIMCATTPGQIQGRSFDGPTSCASWVRCLVWFLKFIGFTDIRILIRKVVLMRYGWLKTEIATSKAEWSCMILVSVSQPDCDRISLRSLNFFYRVLDMLCLNVWTSIVLNLFVTGVSTKHSPW